MLMQQEFVTKLLCTFNISPSIYTFKSISMNSNIMILTTAHWVISFHFDMGRRRDLSEAEKGAINTLIDEGFSQSYIAGKMKINKSTVSRFVNKIRSTKKNSGRKKKSSVKEDRILRRLCLSHRHMSSKALSREWQESTGMIAAPSTIRIRLISLGLISRRMVKKTLLTRKQRLARIAWCRAHRQWTVEQGSLVFFSDESKIELISHPGNARMRRYWESCFFG